MSVDPNFIEEILTKGWRCLNCGENVPNSCQVTDRHEMVQAIVCHGICRSETCKELPPGGNPFHVVIE